MGISTTRILQLFLVGFTSLFLFFMIIYWPMLMMKKGGVPKTNSGILENVRAGDTSGFPIEDSNFKISYELRSDTYYVFVNGNTLNLFVDNKNRAQLALKSALDAESLCDKQIIFTSSQGLDVPASFKTTSNCQ